MSKSNVNPNHYKVAGRERQGEDILQTRHKRKHALSMVRGRSTPHTRTERPALIPGPPPRGAAPVSAAVRTANKGATTAASKRNVAKKKGANTAARKSNAAKKTSMNKQGSDKRGKRSTAQKRASSRHDFGPIPATSPVAGAFGKEPSPRRRKPKKR